MSSVAFVSPTRLTDPTQTASLHRGTARGPAALRASVRLQTAGIRAAGWPRARQCIHRLGKVWFCYPRG